jgi:hypothetical protein
LSRRISWFSRWLFTLARLGEGAGGDGIVVAIRVGRRSFAWSELAAALRKCRVSQRSLLDVFRASGDANLGQSLLRLAALAESRHRFEVAAGHLEQYRKDQRGVEGLDSQAPGLSARTDAGSASVGTEADR